MPSRSFALKTAASLLLVLASGAASAAAIASSVVLTITSPGTIYFGQSVDGYANVTASDGSTPTGAIAFYDGAQNICTIPVSQSASCPASAGTGFAVGTHTLTAAYSGDATHAGATSNAASVTVLPDPTAISLVSSANPAVYGQSITLTATASGAYASPSGVVTFLDGASVLGTAPLNSAEVATFSTASLGTGSHSLTASYAGDSGSASSVSPALAETVSPSTVQGQGGFSITVTGKTTVGVGRTADLTVTVAPAQGFVQAVELSCAGLPTESACTFGQQTIPSGGGTTTLQISTIAPHDCGSSTPYFLSAGIPFAGPAMAGIAVLFLPFGRRRGIRGLLIALVAVCGMSTLTGCGTCTDLGTRPGTYTIRVIGMAAGSGANALAASTAKVTMKVVLN